MFQRRVILGGLAACVLAFGCATFAQADTTWTGGASTSDWDTDGNWDNNSPDDAANNGTAWIQNGSTVTITSSIPATDWNVFLGSGGGNSGTLQQSTGTLSTGGTAANWIWVGDNGGTGRYDLTGDGSLATSRLHVGVVNNASGTMTINTDGTVAVGAGGGDWWNQSSIIVGDSAGANATLNLQKGAVSATDTIWIGAFGSEAAWNQTGGSFSGTFISIGRYGDGTGDLSTTSMTVGGGAATTTVYSSGGIYVADSGGAVDNYDADLTVNNLGKVDSEGDMVVGQGGQGTAGLTVNNGGEANVASTVQRWMIVGNFDSIDAAVDVNSGGALNLKAGTDLRTGENGNSGNRTITVDGGQIIGTAGAGGGSATYIALATGGNGSDTLTVKNGGLIVSEKLQVGNANTVVNFDRGTLKALGSTADFVNLHASATVNVMSGGATFDSDSYTVEVQNALLDGDGGGGGVTKLGAGTLVLNGASTYTGTTNVNEGTLQVDGSIAGGASVASGAALGGNGTVNGGATVAGSVAPGASIGTLSIVGNLTISGSYDVEYDGAASQATDQLIVDGDLTLTGSTITFSSDPGGSGDPLNTALNYTIATYTGTLTGAFTGAAPAGFVLDYSTAGSIVLTAVPEASAFLFGGVACLAGAWGYRRRRNG